MLYAECTTSLTGRRTRQICGFCLPAPRASTPVSLHWRDDRGEYKSRKANSPSRVNAVVESRRPIPLGGIHY